MAYDRIQPFGSERDNWHMAVLATLFAGAHTPKGRRGPDLSEFMYIDRKTKQENETQSFFSKLRAKANAK